MALPPCQSEDDFWDNCVGTYTFHQGHEYVGECKDNKRHGQGTYRVTNVDIYRGQWKEYDECHFQKSHTFVDGSILYE
jgi:hypothetical protein